MLIKDIMKKPVITVKPSDSALKAYRLMQEKNIRRVPVVESGKLAGIITDRDIREAKPSALADLPDKASDDILRYTEVERLMTKDVITVLSDDPVEQAALLMARNKIGGVPVMEKNELVGIVTETDIFRLFTTLFGAEPGYFQVVLLSTEETREAVIRAFEKYSTRIRSIIFSPKYPEIVMVFKTPNGSRDTEEILDELHRCCFQILDWHLFEAEPARTDRPMARTGKTG